MAERVEELMVSTQAAACAIIASSSRSLAERRQQGDRKVIDKLQEENLKLKKQNQDLKIEIKELKKVNRVLKASQKIQDERITKLEKMIEQSQTEARPLSPSLAPSASNSSPSPVAHKPQSHKRRTKHHKRHHHSTNKK